MIINNHFMSYDKSEMWFEIIRKGCVKIHIREIHKSGDDTIVRSDARMELDEEGINELIRALENSLKYKVDFGFGK